METNFEEYLLYGFHDIQIPLIYVHIYFDNLKGF